MKRGPVLIRGSVSTETVECLSKLLEQARRGEVVGIAFGAIMRHSHYMVHASGAATHNPTFTRGVIAALDDKLSQSVHRGGQP